MHTWPGSPSRPARAIRRCRSRCPRSSCGFWPRCPSSVIKVPRRCWRICARLRGGRGRRPASSRSSSGRSTGSGPCLPGGCPAARPSSATWRPQRNARARGASEMVFCWGGPGIGKSSLIEALRLRLPEGSWFVGRQLRGARAQHTLRTLCLGLYQPGAPAGPAAHRRARALARARRRHPGRQPGHHRRGGARLAADAG